MELDSRAMTAKLTESFIQERIGCAERAGRLDPGAGLAVAVVRDGGVVYQGAFGLRDRARNVAMTTTTLFETGSLTKTMTAALFVKAHEEGRLALDEPLAARSTRFRLPGTDAARVSIADVLSHRTGMAAHDLIWYLGGYTTSELANRLVRLEPVPNAFREAFIYNNLLYGCSSVIVEDVLRRSWEELVTEELLGPAGMNATRLDDVPVDDAALPYSRGARIERKSVSMVAPAGGARSNVEDLARWAVLQLGGEESVLGRRALETMHTRRIDAVGMNPLTLAGLEWLGSPAYGYGWFLGRARGHAAVYHMGLIDGFSSLIVLFPDLALGFVVLVSSNMSAFPGALTEELFGHVMGDPPLGVAAVAPAPAPAPVAAATPARARTSPAAGIDGVYVDPAYGSIEVRDGSEGGLCLVYGAHSWPLRFHEPREAELTVSAFGLELPMSVAFADDAVTIPMALDPRVRSRVFVRAR